MKPTGTRAVENVRYFDMSKKMSSYHLASEYLNKKSLSYKRDFLIDDKRTDLRKPYKHFKKIPEVCKHVKSTQMM